MGTQKPCAPKSLPSGAGDSARSATSGRFFAAIKLPGGSEQRSGAAQNDMGAVWVFVLERSQRERAAGFLLAGRRGARTAQRAMQSNDRLGGSRSGQRRTRMRQRRGNH
ncbi:MAG TPA: hypothetical protein VFS21_26375 [Roseiflexaceae bacterium]|nr:hypothetical protein [Roseiflexaceae bacterium]